MVVLSLANLWECFEIFRNIFGTTRSIITTGPRCLIELSVILNSIEQQLGLAIELTSTFCGIDKNFLRVRLLSQLLLSNALTDRTLQRW